MTAATEPDDRRFAGILNFRDYGGYATAGGGRLRRGRLFRSAQHRDATPEDLAAVGTIGFAAVIDLRSPEERRKAPCPRPAGFAARHLFSDADTSGLAPHVEAAGGADTPEGARRAMLGSYGGMPFRAGLVPALRHYFDALATSDGPTLVHCVAGKDRTGLAVALFHAMMGVHRDDIAADYLRTNAASRLEQRVAGAAQASAIEGKAISEEAMAVLMSVDAAYLDAAFAAIDARHGTLDAYLRDVLGVDAGKRDAIAARVLE
ncbi:MAG: tyrosine-protein phosphatase [Sphingomonadaceae bacterium]|nr:tyrosine-protein phosphatase [Sphingomonadaceae bacterium]